MPYVRFVLVGEGALDEALEDHLERLLIWVGATEVSGVAPDLDLLGPAAGSTVEERVRAALSLEPGANLVFVHRDADSPDPDPRRTEIQNGVDQVNPDLRRVPVVPVQETEAWLLLDEGAIRRAAGKPSGRNPLNLPPARLIEGTAGPKEVLHAAIIAASGATGRSLARLQKRLEALKAQMMRQLPVEGPIELLPAWRRLRDDCRSAIEYL